MIAPESLNENQRRAFLWDDGPLLVLAGPGTGKTEVLTLRIARLLEENEQASVLALTFTNKAAAEMRDRLDSRKSKLAGPSRIRTFHGFAVDLLGQHGSHVGIRPDFSLARDEDRIAILEEVIQGLPDRGSRLPSDRINLLRLIDRLFSEAYGGVGASRSLATTPRWLPVLFQRYCDALVSLNRLDFGSLLYFANRLLRQRPVIARMARLGWTYICVDEFQDTNRAQYDLLRLIATEPACNLFVVADADQIIYQWNGASPKRLEDLRRDYNLQTVQLPESYRCLPEVVEHANRLIGHNQGRQTSKRSIVSVRPNPPSNGIVRSIAFEDLAEEVKFLGEDIRERGLSPGACAVVGRTNRMARFAAEALRRAGYDASVSQSKSDFDSPALAVLVEALKLANSPHDRIVLQRLCRQWRRLTGVVIEPKAVEGAAALAGGAFLRAWTDLAAKAKETRAAVRIRSGLVDRLDFPEVVDSFLEGGWRSWGDLASNGAAEEAKRWRILHREIMGGDSGTTLNGYLQRLDLESKTPPLSSAAVRCATVHRSKGLQFQHVYLIGMAQGVFPSFRALQRGPKSAEMEEERRSCFVAITRARESLTLTRANV